MIAALSYRGAWLTGALAGASIGALVGGVASGRRELALAALAFLIYAAVVTVREARLWRRVQWEIVDMLRDLYALQRAERRRRA